MNRIVHSDCLDELKKLPSDYIDLVVTDPPYGMAYQSSRRIDKHKKIANDDNLDWANDTFSEMYRVLKPNTHIYVFCNDYCYMAFYSALKQAGFTPKRTLVWIKNNHTSGDLTGDYGCKTEFILFFHKGRRPLNGRRATNVLHAARVPTTEHPTEKPFDLVSFLIGKSSNVGDIVLDPFVGSGTTCVAAKYSGRRYIGIEREAEYVEIARARLEAVHYQPKLIAAE